MKTIRRLFVGMTAIAFTAASLRGAEYYLSPDGDDGAAGDRVIARAAFADGKAKRLYFDPNKANRAAAAIAPGAWVIDVYRRLRFA